MYPILKARLIQECATAVSLVSIWKGDCPNMHGYHRASVEYARLPVDVKDFDAAGEPTAEHMAALAVCERCGAPRPEDNQPSRSMGRIYNTASGKPEPGDLYYADWLDCSEREKCVYKWTNCTGKHLYAVLPNGSMWDINSRANNCTMPEDTTHRCWVRHGEVPDIHVDKQGHTCAAGAGSIVSGNYHGFLIKGHFIDCEDPQFSEHWQRLLAQA